jgi:hypothetical protein
MPHLAARLAITAVMALVAAPWALAWRSEDENKGEERRGHHVEHVAVRLRALISR